MYMEMKEGFIPEFSMVLFLFILSLCICERYIFYMIYCHYVQLQTSWLYI